MFGAPSAMRPCASDSEAAAQEFCFEVLLMPPLQYGATSCRRAASTSVAEFAFLSSATSRRTTALSGEGSNGRASIAVVLIDCKSRLQGLGYPRGPRHAGGASSRVDRHIWKNFLRKHKWFQRRTSGFARLPPADARGRMTPTDQIAMTMARGE